MAVLTEEQSMLRDSARDFLRENAPVAQLRRLRAFVVRKQGLAVIKISKRVDVPPDSKLSRELLAPQSRTGNDFLS